MTAAGEPEVVTLRSRDAVVVRQIQPGDAPALVRAYANLGEQSRYRRFFTDLPELPEDLLQAAVQVDHTDQEALVALPPQSAEIVGESRYVRLADQPDTADVGAAVVDAWQGRGLGSALLTRLGQRALEAGIEYFTAQILAENRPRSRSCRPWAGWRPNRPAPWSPSASSSPSHPGRPGRSSWS